MIRLPRSCSGMLHYDWTNGVPVCAWYDAWGVKQRLSAGFRLKLPTYRHAHTCVCVCVCVLGCACLSLCLVIAVAFRCGPIRIISATLTPSIFFRLKSSWILVATPALFIFLVWLELEIVRSLVYSTIFVFSGEFSSVVDCFSDESFFFVLVNLFMDHVIFYRSIVDVFYIYSAFFGCYFYE